MSDVELGKIIEGEANRDAIHIAIAPVVATKELYPGQKIRLTGSDGAAEATDGNHHGIVDPFLGHKVCEGQKFYMWLTPNTVTGMRHHWEHPAFREVAVDDGFGFTPEESRAWIEGFVERNDLPSYEFIVAAATGQEINDPDGYLDYMCDSEYLTILGTDAYGQIDPDLWDHIENATGKKCPVRPSTFSCSC